MSVSSVISVAQVRELFFTYFESKEHTRVESSSLIPHNDPTLLFTNAGMNQFKDTFLGLEKRPYTRAVSSQKCVRAGGKHNDLDNVGYTARHHTFFEMLGNFSFGDYFKKEAIGFAWEFLTSAQYLNLPKDRLYVTVYHTDDEAVAIWNNEIGVPLERIIKVGDNKGAPYASDNFWAMGDTGPCGPCSEIFYDHGEHIAGGLPGTPEEDGDRFIEIWNIVFMQFNRTIDGQLNALPAPCVDTGMGLERISAVMQHVNSNYEIDLFKHLIFAASAIVDIEDTTLPSLKVLADHIRSSVFLIADGVIPSNEGRGYVLRRIIRRAIRHGNKLGAEDVFFYRLVESLIFVMGQAYPYLVAKHDQIVETLIKEEEQFAKTLEQGLKQFESAIAEASNIENGVIAGEVVFKLYDTYGFPSDLTADIARERNLTIDEAGFDEAMNEQRQRARDAGKFTVDYNAIVNVDTATAFVGYTQHTVNSTITALYKDGQQVQTVSEGDEALIVLAITPFYAESGGQVGDTGKLTGLAGVFEVQDTKKSGHAIVHRGVVTMGQINAKDTVEAQIDNSLRSRIIRNHSATHLLHAALRKVLGNHVEQKGSLVTADGLRFDFAQPEAVSVKQLAQLEAMVTELILANTTVACEEMPMKQALEKGAIALFGEKYGDDVRVLSMGENIDNTAFSVELCGGVHVQRTGDIGGFKIVTESGIAAGVRRIEAKTGFGALQLAQQADSQLAQICQLTKATRAEAAVKVVDLFDKVRDLEKQLERANQKIASTQTANLLSQFVPVAHTTMLVAQVEADNKSLRLMVESLKAQRPDSVVVLVGQDLDKLAFVASVPASITASIKAGDIVKHLATQLDGKGGGKPDFAQGGSAVSAKLDEVMTALPEWIQAKV